MLYLKIMIKYYNTVQSHYSYFIDFVWQMLNNMLLFNYKINELWISQLFKISRMCTREYTYFFIVKNRADREIYSID